MQDGRELHVKTDAARTPIWNKVRNLVKKVRLEMVQSSDDIIYTLLILQK